MTVRHRRRQLFIDAQLQGTMIARVFVYFACCIACLILFGTIWLALRHWPISPAEILMKMKGDFGPAFLGVLFLLPIVVLDCLKLSHRMAGPFLRIRREIKKLANGEPARVIKLRKGDYLQDLVDDLNRVIECQQQSAAAAEQAEEVAFVTDVSDDAHEGDEPQDRNERFLAAASKA